MTPEAKTSLGRRGSEWKNNVKLDLKEYGTSVW